MKKRYLLLVAISCFLFLFQTVAEAQDSWGSLQVLGGIGVSNAPKDFQKERNQNYERISMANALNYSSSFSPGLFARGEIHL